MAAFIFIAIAVILVIVIVWQLLVRARVGRYGFGNLLIFGGKGSGKDFLMAFMAWKNRRKKKQLSNIPNAYGYGETVEIKELTVEPNTYQNFLKGDLKIVPKKDRFERSTYYLSDAGIYLPNYADAELKKQYPSLPIYYALSRQLYNQNIILNSQEFDRPWRPLRKQADSWIHMLSCRKLLGFLPIFVLRGIYYDREQSAESGVLPLKGNLLTQGRTGRAQVKIYQAQHGSVEKFTLLLTLKHIKYDTRYFHERVFGYKAKDIKKHKREVRKNEKK